MKKQNKKNRRNNASARCFLMAGTAILVSLNSFASTVEFPSLTRDSSDTVVSLPTTSAIAAKGGSAVSGPSQGTTQLEFNMGSWTPSDFQISSQLSNSTAFTGAGLPAFDVAFDLPIAKALIKTGRLMVSLGFGFDTLQRSGTLTLNAVSSTVNQTVYLTSLSAGLEYLVGIPKLNWLEFEGKAALVPTTLSTSNSAFGDGSFSFGVPVEMGVSAVFNLQSAGLPVSGTYLTFGAVDMLGSLAGGSVNGAGWVGGVRVNL